MSYIKNGVMYRDDGTVRSVRAAAEPKTVPVKNSGVYLASGGGGSTGITYTYRPMTGTTASTWPFEDDGEVQIEELWKAVQAAALPDPNPNVVEWDEFGLPVFK